MLLEPKSKARGGASVNLLKLNCMNLRELVHIKELLQRVVEDLSMKNAR